MLFDKLDILTDVNGNFVTQNGDILAANSVESVRRTIEWRLKTGKDEWAVHNSEIAGDLPNFIGRTNILNLHS